MRRSTCFVLLSGALLSAQPAFEVASIRLRDITKPDGRKPGFSVSGDKVSLIAMPLVSLVGEAYGLQEYQVTGGPKWAGDFVGGAYDIVANTGTGAPPTREQARQMLQGLLADRFRLRFHLETRDLPVFAMLAARRGPKLQESAGEATFSNRQSMVGQAIRMVAIHNTVAQLANAISPYTGRPVIDETGLANPYDFTLEFMSEGRKGPSAPDADPAAPSILVALEEQLGLKLEPRKQPTEILVIDRAERPSEN
jgi:uncharacterized protein (TIGR03435 family)